MSREVKGRLLIIVALLLSVFGASLAGTSLALAKAGPQHCEKCPQYSHSH